MRKMFPTFLLLAITPAAWAYVGPGAGITLIGSVLSFLVAGFLGLLAVLVWVVRRIFKRKQAGAESSESAPTEPND